MICGPITHLQFLLNLRVNWTQIKKMIFKPNRPSVRFVCWSVVSLPFFVFLVDYAINICWETTKECPKSLSLQKVHDFRFGVRKLGFLVKRSTRTCPGSTWQSACSSSDGGMFADILSWLAWGPLRWSTNSSWDFTNSSWNFINSSWNFINSSWNFAIHSE